MEENNEDVETKVPPKRFRTFKPNTKRGRLIIRNLSYSVTEELLKEHFSQHGEIDDINLLRRPDKKLVGCAFIQYKNRNDAAKAITKTNDQEYLNRKIKVDWAVSRDVYESKNPPKGDKKAGDKKQPNKKPKKENFGIKSESKEADIKSEDYISIKSEDDVEDNDDSYDSFDDDDEEDDEEHMQSEDEQPSDKDNDSQDANNRKQSNDVDEGCTIFIKEVPFDMEAPELQKLLVKYGKLRYVILNKDKISGHSKGTAFAKFHTKESAEICLQDNYSIKINNNVLEFLPAMSRATIQNKLTNEKHKEARDSRNLYLLKEGIVYANSKSAEGVSASDMALRLRLEQSKTKMLKNLNHFISRERLIVHNLPDDYNNKKLFEMAMKVTQAKPIECLVIRDNNVTAKQPMGKSKNFGFLKYKRHEDALFVLRKINNNPSIFSKSRRPIVSFSLEDKSVINVKQKRAEKSKLNNPTYQKKLESKKLRRKLKREQMRAANNSSSEQNTADNPTATPEKSETLTPNSTGKNKKNKKNKKKERKASVNNQVNEQSTNEDNADNIPEYSGIVSERGSIKLRKFSKINDQISQHTKSVKKVKRQQKKNKEKREILKEKRQSDRMKPKVKVENDAEFTELVNKHKRLLDAAASTGSQGSKPFKRTKWYQD